MAKLFFGATLLLALVNVRLPLRAQVSHFRREGAQGVTLSVCNAGNVDIDVLVAKSSPVVTTHIAPNTCAPAYSDSAGVPAFVGFALIDSHGQWGTPRRLGLLPDLGLGDFSMSDILPALGLGGASTRSRVLDSAARDVSVRRGNQDVPAQLQLSFRPMHARLRKNSTITRDGQ